MTAGDVHLMFWRDFAQLLQGTLGERVAALWILPLKPILYSGGKLILGAPGPLHERIVRERYLPLMRRCARALSGREVLIEFVPAAAHSSAASDGEAPPLPPSRAAGAGSCPLNERYTFRNFVVGSCNKAAHTAAVAAAKDPGGRQNPLFITGGVGLGKTHLLQAIGARALEEGRHRFAYIPSDRLVDRLMEACADRTIARLRARLSSVSLLLIDDVHFLSGRNQVQEEFFAIFTALCRKRLQIVLTSDRHPRDIPRLHQRLVARFESGSVAELAPPSLATRVSIIRRKADLLGVKLPAEMVVFLAGRIRTNVRSMEGALNSIAVHLRLSGSFPDRAEIEQLLADVMPPEGEEGLTIRKVQQRVAAHFRITMACMLGGARRSEVVFPRQLAMYLCRALIGLPYADIAAAFSGRDHTTALHSCKTIAAMLRNNCEARETADALAAALRP